MEGRHWRVRSHWSGSNDLCCRSSASRPAVVGIVSADRANRQGRNPSICYSARGIRQLARIAGPGERRSVRLLHPPKSRAALSPVPEPAGALSAAGSAQWSCARFGRRRAAGPQSDGQTRADTSSNVLRLVRRHAVRWPASSIQGRHRNLLDIFGACREMEDVQHPYSPAGSAI